MNRASRAGGQDHTYNGLGEHRIGQKADGGRPSACQPPSAASKETTPRAAVQLLRIEPGATPQLARPGCD
jgi:hypothetical protein